MSKALPFTYDDGGRAVAGFRGEAGDCAVRSIAIATGLPYRAVYDTLNQDARTRPARSRQGPDTARRNGHGSARTGLSRPIYDAYLRRLGWQWTPTMRIGSGTTVHLAKDELPKGRLIARCSKHLTAVVDEVIHDTHDPARDGQRAVYGYWQPPVRWPEINTVLVVCASHDNEVRSVVATSNLASLMESIYTHWRSIAVFGVERGTVDDDCQVAGAGMLDGSLSWWSERSVIGTSFTY